MGGVDHLLPVLHISRLRINMDGAGVTSLVGLAGCPNHCRYCINFRRLQQKPVLLAPTTLYQQLMVDDLYFRATGGGVTFGGGEPLLSAGGIADFARLVAGSWQLRMETSLNVPWAQVEVCLPWIDQWIVDVKDMNDAIYRAYTGCSGQHMRENLSRLAALTPEKLQVRLPRIPGYNTADDLRRSHELLQSIGVVHVTEFDYKPFSANWPED